MFCVYSLACLGQHRQSRGRGSGILSRIALKGPSCDAAQGQADEMPLAGEGGDLNPLLLVVAWMMVMIGSWRRCSVFSTRAGAKR